MESPAGGRPSPPEEALSPAGGRLPLRGRWTGRSPGRMRGPSPPREPGQDEWERSISQPRADRSLYARVSSAVGDVHRNSFVFCSWAPLIRQGLRPATFPVGEGFLRRGPGMTGGSGRAEGPTFPWKCATPQTCQIKNSPTSLHFRKFCYSGRKRWGICSCQETENSQKTHRISGEI